jgi:uncharacterized membrane protein required for colicin V production
MKDFISYLIVGIGIAGFVGGLIAAVLFAPKLSADRRQWFKRSVLSSFFAASGIFILVLSIGGMNDLLSLQGEAFWNSILVMLEYFLLGTIIFALLNYARILLLEKHTEMMGRLIKRLNNRGK